MKAVWSRILLVAGTIVTLCGFALAWSTYDAIRTAWPDTPGTIQIAAAICVAGWPIAAGLAICARSEELRE